MRLLGGEGSPLCRHGAWDRPAGEAGGLACFHWAGPTGCFSEQKIPFKRVCGASLGGVCWGASVPALHSGGAWEGTLLLGVLGKERPECVGRRLSGAGRHLASGLRSLLGCWGHRGRG